LRWERLHVDLSWRPLFDRTGELAEVSLEGPAVRLERRPDGAIDPLAHAAPSVPAESPAAAPPEPVAPAAEEAAEPWAISVGRLALRRPDVVIADESSGVQLVEVGFDELALDAIRVKGSEIGLGGVSLASPVVRVRRDFLLGKAGAKPQASGEPPAAPPARAGAGPTRASSGSASSARASRGSPTRARSTSRSRSRPRASPRARARAFRCTSSSGSRRGASCSTAGSAPRRLASWAS
jgi:hypothetical protein